ncbi:MAG: TlpA family protein disulfide reductase [Alphaproteobacteria bacterium]
MKQKKQKDIWFVINAFAVGLIVLAVMHSIKPYLEPPDPLKPQIMDYATAIKVMEADAIPPLLKSKNGKPTLMVVYASWCPACRMKMPDIISLMREGKLAHVNMLFLSRDSSLMKLSEYLVHAGFYKDMDAYIAQSTALNPLDSALSELGSGYKGTVPFMELYDASGKAVRQIPHNSSKDAILEATKNF